MTTPLPTSWESDILTALHVPVTPNNVQSLDVWQKAEGGSTNNPDSYNPFNTTLPEPGSSPTNSVGVQAFPDWATGLQATVATIEQDNMRTILDALQGDVSKPQFEAAVNASPWGTHFAGAPDLIHRIGGDIVAAPGHVVGGIAGVPGAIARAPGNVAGGAASLGGNVLSDFLKNIISSGLVIRSTLVVVGLVILFIGLAQVSKGDNSAAQTVTGGTTTVVEHVKDQKQKAQARGQQAVKATAAPEEAVAGAVA